MGITYAEMPGAHGGHDALYLDGFASCSGVVASVPSEVVEAPAGECVVCGDHA
jgi:hypothetical protein